MLWLKWRRLVHGKNQGQRVNWNITSSFYSTSKQWEKGRGCMFVQCTFISRRCAGLCRTHWAVKSSTCGQEMKEIKQRKMLEKKQQPKVDITGHDTKLMSTAGAKKVKGPNPLGIRSHYLSNVADDRHPSSTAWCPEAEAEPRGAE